MKPARQTETQSPYNSRTKRIVNDKPPPAGFAGDSELQALANVIQTRDLRAYCLWRATAGATSWAWTVPKSVKGGRRHARALPAALSGADGVVGRRATIWPAGHRQNVVSESRGHADEDDVLQHQCVVHRLEVPRRLQKN